MNIYSSSSKLSRRAFLLRSLALSGLGLFSGKLFSAFNAANFKLAPFKYRHPKFDQHNNTLYPTADLATGLELLQLPHGFHYTTINWFGDQMEDGLLTPSTFDGMGVVQFIKTHEHKSVVLIRNHEIGIGPVIGTSSSPVYDSFTAPSLGFTGFGGGTTSIVFDTKTLSTQSVSATLGGTVGNCSGSSTPWNSWLSCEEAVVHGELLGAKRHGYVFEVPSPKIASAQAAPIIDMGLMDHEAAAIDEHAGTVYLTEDNGPNSGFYRYRPFDNSQQIGSLTNGGILEMLKVIGISNADLRNVAEGQTFDTEWVVIDDPNKLPEQSYSPFPNFPSILFRGPSGPYAQGFNKGAARFSRLEGCVYYDEAIYFTDTDAGITRSGIIWCYDLDDDDKGKLTAFYVPDNLGILRHPDNLAVSRKGLFVVCEDSSRSDGTRLVLINEKGLEFLFARNNVMIDSAIPGKPMIVPGDYRKFEFAGACFDPHGKILFVNIIQPGILFAISGPWEQYLRSNDHEHKKHKFH